MESTQIPEYDYLRFSSNTNIKKNVIFGEQICYSNKITKINKRGWKQERNILITDKAIYNLKKQDLKRRIKYQVVCGITVSKLGDEFIIHCVDDDYDYQYISDDKKKIVEIIAQNYLKEVQSDLKLCILNIYSLGTLVTTKKEKNKDKSFSRMPRTNIIGISEFLYGIEDNSTANKSMKKMPSRVRTNTICNNNKEIFKCHSASIEDFEILKTIGRGSVGKILLAKFKGKTNEKSNLFAIKCMRKDQLISDNIIDNILGEKLILNEGHCNFIINLSFYFQSDSRIYFVTPFLQGGDLYQKLKKDIILPEDLVKFYAAQVAIAIQHLHNYEIAYRDLKPENILIDKDGYIKLCDFGSVVNMHDISKEYSFAGSLEYVAPEIISREGHDTCCDWWSFGILIYELLYGFTPFYNNDKKQICQLIVQGEIKFPKSINIEDLISDDQIAELELDKQAIQAKLKKLKISEDAKDIIKKLLEKDPTQRLGVNGLNEIRSHPFFSTINFDLIKVKKLKSPFKPELSTENITENFDEDYLKMDIAESPVENWIAQYKDHFNGFDGENMDL